MTPEKNKILLADCMDIMAQMPNKFIDLALVDPPYGIKEDGRNNHTRGKLAKAKDYRNNSKYDNAIPDKKYFDELFRISKNQIIFGGNYFLCNLYNTSCFIVWDKENGDTDFADCELAWTSFKTATRRFKYKWQGMLQENMKQKDILMHPNQKPLALGRWCLQKYAKKGDVIFDSHSGSGTFAIAAYLEGHDFIACEKDIDYHKDSVKRFEEIKMQGRLFI